MTPILSLWQSTDIKEVALESASIIKEIINEDKSLYEDILCFDYCVEKLLEKISESFQRMIKLSAVDTTLHIVAFTTLYSSDFTDQIRRLSEACRRFPNRKSLHVVAFRASLARALGVKQSDAESKEKDNIEFLQHLATEGDFCFSFSFLDDFAASGATFDFNRHSLAGFLALFLSSLIRSYHSILAPTLLASNTGESLSFGCSSLYFDLQSAIAYLRHSAFIAALEKSGIDKNTVDASKASDHAIRILKNIRELYGNFYEKQVHPLYKDSGKTEAEVVSETMGLMNKEFEDLENDLTSFITDNNLTLPEKEAVLALLLGNDNKRLRGVQYDQESLLVDDGLAEPLKLYVSTFNRLAPTSGLLPLRGDYASLKKYVWNDMEGKFEESSENKLAFYPLPLLKKLKTEIQNTTAFIRKKIDELADLEEIEAEQESETKNEGKKWGISDLSRRYEIKEQPLDEIYRPDLTLKPKGSVDLRPFFSKIRSQGKLGSCSTFAVVSIYEYIMNRCSRSTMPTADMSEQFVYYYSNVITGNPEGGSNYYDQLSILGSKGVCNENLFGYTIKNLSKEPPQEAVEDAMKHRVLKALQIPLASGGSAIDCLMENHRLLTSALSEGYPVGIALKIYNSFGVSSPFINRPDNKDFDSGGEGYHAMVIVGYSEADKCYIVRNSWGEDFGDKGYCYISSAYIDDPSYNNFACIIKQTTELDTDGDKEDIPQLIAPFAGSENQIKMAVIRNILDQERVKLNVLEERYRDLYSYYQRIIQQLCNHSVRKPLRQFAEDESAQRLLSLKRKEDSLLNDFAENISVFKKNYIKQALKFSLFTLACDIAAGIYTRFGEVTKTMVAVWIICILITLAAIIIWLNYKWNVRRKRRELQEQIANIASERDRVSKELLEKQLRYHVAGMWIDSFHDLTVSLQRKYDRLVAFNNSLYGWYQENKRALDTPAEEPGQMFMCINNFELLDKYFKTNKQLITDKVDLVSAYHSYSDSNKRIDELEKILVENTDNAIKDLFKSFSMVNLLCGNKIYPYIKEPDLFATIGEMLSVGQIATRFNTDRSITPMRIMFIKGDRNELDTWRVTSEPMFPYPQPAIKESNDRCRLDLISIQPVSINALR